MAFAPVLSRPSLRPSASPAQKKGFGKMKGKTSSSDIAALKSAADAVMAHNAELTAHIKSGVGIFSKAPPLSELLKCETNGAHKYIEDFATALKALPRGCACVKRVMKRMLTSCKGLIDALRKVEGLLPDSVPEADRRAFLDGVEFVAAEEAGFYNLATGESGAPPDCYCHTYCFLIDRHIRRIKTKFTNLNIAVQHIERDLRAPRPAPKDAGFKSEDRRMLRQIRRATVLGKVTPDAELAGDVRRQQVLYGAKLYRKPTKYDKDRSSYRAAEMAIRAPQFKGVEGAYSIKQKNTLARAIRREYNSP